MKNNLPEQGDKMKETEIMEQNIMLAEYEQIIDTSEEFYKYKHGNDHYAAEGLKYHKSWDWQIKVYSRLGKAMQKLAFDNILNHEFGMRWARLMRDHSNATFNNNPLEGFKILVENLKWLNTQQK